MQLDEKQIEHIADLANLELNDDEKSSITGDFLKILAYIEKINELELDDVQETLQIFQMNNVMREDQVNDSLKPEEVLSMSPEQANNQVKVPKFL